MKWLPQTPLQRGPGPDETSRFDDVVLISLMRHDFPSPPHTDEAIDPAALSHQSSDGRLVPCRRPAYCRECERWLGHSALVDHIGLVDPDHRVLAGDVRSGVLGRPYLAALPADVSLSHTRRAIVTAVFSRGVLLGVDLEDAAREVSLEPLPARERDWVLSSQGAFPAVAPYVCREALGKTLGIGLLGRWRLYDLESITPIDAPPGCRAWEVEFAWFRALKGVVVVTDTDEVIGCVATAKLSGQVVTEVLALAGQTAA